MNECLNCGAQLDASTHTGGEDIQPDLIEEEKRAMLRKLREAS